MRKFFAGKNWNNDLIYIEMNENETTKKTAMRSLGSLGYAAAKKGNHLAAINLRNIDHWVFENNRYFVTFKSGTETFDSIDHPAFHVYE